MFKFRFWIWALMVTLGIASAPPAAAGEVRLNVLNYNIHGLPEWLIDDDPKGRIPTIGRLFNAYDVVLVQEDFLYHDLLKGNVRHPIVVRGDSSMLAANTIGTIGDGLTILSKVPGQKLVMTEKIDFESCHGYFDQGWDCFSSKGALMVRLRFEGGMELDVYNTHLDSGGNEDDIQIAAAQLELLAEMINRLSAGRAIVLGGDFNLDWKDKGMRKVAKTFADQTGLKYVRIRRPGRHIEHTYIRSGSNVHIEVVATDAPRIFAKGDLSDHPAILAELRVFHPGQ